MFDLQEKFWNREWSVGIIITAIFLLINYYGGFRVIEQKIYDWSIQHLNHQPGKNIVIVAVDQNTRTQLGDWTWSYALQAQLIDLLGQHAKVIGNTLEFTQPHYDPNFAYLDDSLNFYQETLSLNQFSQEIEKFNELMKKINTIRVSSPSDKANLALLLNFYRSSTLATDLPDALGILEDKLNSAQLELPGNRRLAHSFKTAGNVLLSFSAVTQVNRQFSPQSPILPVLPARQAARFQISRPLDEDKPLPNQVMTATLPQVELVQQTAGLGYLGFPADNPRQQPLVVKYRDGYFPSLSLLLFAKSLGLNREDIHIKLGEGVRLKLLTIPTNAHLEFKPFFYKQTDQFSPFPIYSMVDVLKGKVPVETYKNKIVLIGSTLEFSTLYSTPWGKMSAVIILANSVASLLNQHYFVTPIWLQGVQIGFFLLSIIYLTLLLPRLKPKIARVLSLALIVMLSLPYTYLLKYGFTIELVAPILLIPCTHVVLLVKRAMVAYRDAFRLHPDAVESNRLLGLAFQGQGHLDLAFEKFRLCPLEETTMGSIYNLALDYEMKRQYRRAIIVYRYLHNHNPSFRDIERRIEWLESQKKHNTNKRLLDWSLKDTDEKPQLGRYQIEKQLGKGAMGIVYLGREPKLNRVVAIKTMTLVQEFESEELEEVTTRFFREASAAGRLRHPHIVSMYDAGEEHNLAYIAMEYFSGGDLVPYTKQDNLLPITTVIDIVSHAAEALDYAHQHGVIHRDIKPANVMYNRVTGKIKIADFGIARIVDTSKTKTGVILGTPSYMSPEQLAGKQLDGRTDLFSLGVMLYQLLTGKLPFQADSMATLMFKIANEPHPNIVELRADLPPCLKEVIDIALRKEPPARYQTGTQFAQVLRHLDWGTVCV